MASKILISLTLAIESAVAFSGYCGIFGLMALGCACIPLPSEVVMLFAGSLAAKGRFDLWVAVCVGCVGCVAGSVAAYWAGYYGGRNFVRRYRRYFLISSRDLDRADRWFERYGDATVFFSRMMPIIRAFISLPAGVARMPFWRFCLYTFLGSVPWCLGLAYFGYRAGGNWQELHDYFRDFDVLILALGVGVVVWWVWRHVRQEKEAAVTAPGESKVESRK